MVGPFGLRSRGTMRVRALPMAKALASHGHAVTVILPPWRDPEDAGRRWEEDGITIENIDLPPRIPFLFHLLTALRLAWRALTLRPDVVHLFKPKAYSGLTHWLLSHLPLYRHPRLVVDTDDWEGPGGWNELGDYTAVHRRLFAWQERWGLTHADAVTAASRTLESLTWALGVPPGRVFYVPNGVSSTHHAIRNVEPMARDPRPAVLLYTRFFEFPVSRVVEVFRGVRGQVPEARLIVVGKGLFGEEEKCLRLAREAGFTVADYATCNMQHELCLTHDVTYVGWVPTDMLSAYFDRADVAIYPFDDSLVNRAKCAVKLLDLLTAGVPVVAEAVGQNREYVRHGETGWLIAPGDISSFVDAVVRLLEDASLRKRLGRAAARDVRERFAWEDLVSTVKRAYRVDR